LKHHVRIGPRFDLERTRLVFLLWLGKGGANLGCRFYAAEVCLGLKWIHKMGMIYRALSLGHVLLGLDGHIKLVDFAVAKVGLEFGSKTKTFCGQAELIAPEVSTTTN
jgi:serine/threonine protein kinase